MFLYQYTVTTYHMKNDHKYYFRPRYHIICINVTSMKTVVPIALCFKIYTRLKYIEYTMLIWPGTH